MCIALVPENSNIGLKRGAGVWHEIEGTINLKLILK